MAGNNRFMNPTKMKKMKNNILLLIIFCFSAFACEQETYWQQPLDSTAPGPVSGVSVINTPGGAILTYKLPVDEDLLYVKVLYQLKDSKTSEVRASLYTDTLEIEGFGDTSERVVRLYAVDRSRNESPETDATINPLEPPVKTIGKTLQLIPDFGGVHAYWTDSTRAKISAVILKKDNNDEYAPVGTFYSSVIDGDGAARGMDTIPSDFGVYVQDRWENRSDTLFCNLTPLYETEFDKNKFSAVYLPNDAEEYPGWVISNIWDGTTGNNGFSSTGGTGVWPQSITIDLGVVGQISRITLFQRLEPYIFAEGNLRKFQVWGCVTLDPSGSWDSWTELMDCTSVKPSGLELGQNSDEDIAVAYDGEDFTCPPTAPKVRYIRILVTQTWAGGDNFQISELNIYGDNRE